MARGKTPTRYQHLELEKAHGVAIVWLNRPEVRNAFNETMIAELTLAFRALDKDREVRAVVLAGRGPVFCAGADLNWMKKMAGYSFAQNRRDALGMADMLSAIHTLSKPTIARVHGAAFAGGMGLLSACDIAVASQETEFCLSEVKLGLIPATISPYVLAAIGTRAAQRYFLTAERFPAAEAYRIGLVQEITLPAELDAKVNEILGDIVQASPAAIAQSKILIGDVAGRPIDRKLIGDTAGRIARARASADGKEGVRAFLEKRVPAWHPKAKPSNSAKPSSATKPSNTAKPATK